MSNVKTLKKLRAEMDIKKITIIEKYKSSQSLNYMDYYSTLGLLFLIQDLFQCSCFIQAVKNL